MRGAHLGCGAIILPATDKLPQSYDLFPEAAGLFDAAVEWDNIDINQLPGVDKIINLFDYPWPLESNAYDVVVVSHLAEHIPHHIMRGGQIIGHDPEFQDGWFAFFGEVWRILKPSGKCYCAVPWAWSNSGISDPTHTRYVTLATMIYLNNADGENSPFKYRMGGQWETININDFIWRPHVQAVSEIIQIFKTIRETSLLLSKGTYDAGVREEWFTQWGTLKNMDSDASLVMHRMVDALMQSGVNMAVDFMVTMTAVK
jgi:hypothetical protein